MMKYIFALLVVLVPFGWLLLFLPRRKKPHYLVVRANLEEKIAVFATREDAQSFLDFMALHEKVCGGTGSCVYRLHLPQVFDKMPVRPMVDIIYLLDTEMVKAMGVDLARRSKFIDLRPGDSDGKITFGWNEHRSVETVDRFA